VLDFAPAGSGQAVESVSADPGRIRLQHLGSSTHLELNPQGIRITGPERVELAGLRATARPAEPKRPQAEAVAVASRLADPPAVDGSLDGFDTDETLVLDSELQYRRSEDPYEAEEFNARAWVNWDGRSLYLAVHVAKPDLIFRDPAAAPLNLDNEPEDINGDGLQVYLRLDRDTAGVLVTPLASCEVRTRAIGTETELAVSGRWDRTEDGYLVTLALEEPAIRNLHPGSRVGFDLIVNEMQPGRQRRAGQLVWSGHGGWVYLRGDRHDPGQLGVLELG
jgi:hypothetical protein